MYLPVLAFLAGILLLYQFPWQLPWQLPRLPAAEWAWLLLPLFPSMLLVRPRWRLPLWAAAGLLWALWRASLVLELELPPEWEGADLWAEGVVASLPETEGGRSRFILVVERLERGDEVLAWPGRARLSWRGAPRIEAGERWRLPLRLKRPHGFMNPGGFDYEGWLFRHGVRATGYVHGDGGRRLAAAPAHSLDRWRQRLREEIAALRLEHGGVLAALAVGDRQGIDRERWRLFTATGTNHLMAISGLHVGLVAGLALLLGRWGWARGGHLVERLPAPQAGAMAAILAALGYAALAGFSVPTRRAAVMVVVFMLGLLLRRRGVPLNGLALALAAVLLLDPAAVVDPGFWLSFAAVAVILLGMGGRLNLSRWAGIGRVQWLVALGLAPLLVLWFGGFSLVAPLANLVAVPWVSLAVVPATLLGTLMLPLWEWGGSALLGLADLAFGLLWYLLEWLAALPWAQWRQGEAPPWALAAALLGAVLLVAPRGLPGRPLGLVLLLPMLLLGPPRPAPGSARVTLLDVGQGLAVVVESAGHVAVFDTGPRFGDFDTGWAVVAPYLRSRGWSAVDLLLLSHGSNDHAGGAASLVAELPVRRVLLGGGEPPPGVGEVEPCRAGWAWSWDGVGFRILHPPAGYSGEENDLSCVLRVTAGEGSALLTGDIEARAEAALLATGEELRAGLLQVPHHGSRTSSTTAFIRAVAPEQVVYAVGRSNRFRFPRPEVTARYAAAGVREWRTDRDGALLFRLGPEGLGGPLAWRQAARRFWHE